MSHYLHCEPETHSLLRHLARIEGRSMKAVLTRGLLFYAFRTHSPSELRAGGLDMDWYHVVGDRIAREALRQQAEASFKLEEATYDR